MNNPKKDYNDPKTVGKYVGKNIQQVHIYYLLAFKLIANLKETKLDNDFPYIVDCLYEACLTKYVSSLWKIFGPTKEATLWQLLKLATELSENDFEERLKKEDPSNINEIRQQREELVNNRKNMEKRIKEIKKKISPLRNKEREHNLPWAYKKIEEQERDCEEIKEWLDFAEETFEKCMCVLSQFCLKAGNFGSPECASEIEKFLTLINDKSLERVDLPHKYVPTFTPNGYKEV